MNSDEAGKSQTSVGSGLSELQFDRAEPEHPTATACAACGAPVVDSYYALNGFTLCPSCAKSQRFAAPGEPTKGDFVRAALYGAGAALAGTAVYFAILALSGYEIGWIAVAVGWLVGKAVQKGSRGLGGRKLQIMAVVLTYFSIVGSYVPLTIKYAMDNPPGQKQSAESGAKQSPTAVTEREPVSLPRLLVGLVMIFAICLVSPFLHGFSSIIGIFIIGIGLFEAWKLNKRVPITLEGPFSLQQPGAGS